MIHDCARFDAWLDGGRDATHAASATAHAAGCARCAGARELEVLLGEPPVLHAGAAFTEGVMFRVRDAERARAAARLVLTEPESPWWLRAPAEPSAALAFALAALLAWRTDGLWAFALRLAARARARDWAHGPGSGALDAIGSAFSAVPSGPVASTALLAVLLPVVMFGSWLLYVAIERRVAGSAAAEAGAWPGLTSPLR